MLPVKLKFEMKKFINKKITVLTLILNIIIIFSGFCYGLINPLPAQADTKTDLETSYMAEGCEQTAEATEQVSVNHQHDNIMPCCVEQKDHAPNVSEQKLSFLKSQLLTISIASTDAVILDNKFFYQSPTLSPPEKALIDSTILRV
ncbi:MAG: hypothetical protein UT48_C0031G0005 [Parcubacteria group bacterium GW2011_GWE2_39_37]|uniref:Uncharacterized protein n=1 Tax=Candidatus Falkowbacteria bacterium GW2011_GWF2_39_8 TaxID=1618642 RepID=A0A0G0PXG9_9BACT|nr:MAG: hypothetical protein UT48_C0031G0005 [Parcubacteria group bacterium GW2011_GWE2_39_37]KKR32839.1 MAG: hypothetical protein UT64_C0021G0010 [Candidatus Falkowbacteria bacterium GW2011_GWF2_39_8]